MQAGRGPDAQSRAANMRTVAGAQQGTYPAQVEPGPSSATAKTMPLGDLAAGLFELVGRFIGPILVEFVFEILIQGTGYLIVRYVVFLNQQEVDPDGPLATITGLSFWVAIATILI